MIIKNYTPSVFWRNFDAFLSRIKENIYNIIKINYHKKLYVLKYLDN
jgi:hypothetical protein